VQGAYTIDQPGPIDIRHEVYRQAIHCIAFERLRRHDRAQVRAADADIEHIRKPLTRRPDTPTRVHIGYERAALGTRVGNGCTHVHALHQQRLGARIAQRRVQRGAPFRRVDDGPVGLCEQRCRQLGTVPKRQQIRERRVVHQLTRVIEHHTARFHA